MKRGIFTWRTLLCVLTVAIFALVLVGSGVTNDHPKAEQPKVEKSKSEHPTEQPKSEHLTEQPKEEKSKSEHPTAQPKVEQPKSEHPK